MTEENETDWDLIQALARRVLEQGEALELSDETRALLHSGAREVAISPEDAEDAVRSVSTATTLLREIGRRMEDGNARLSRASSRAYRLRDEGDFTGARKLMEDLLAVEVVPLYRRIAEGVLARTAHLETVARSGRVDTDVNPWDQVRVLARRLQQGQPLELREELRDFLRQTAPSLAIGEAEAEEALKSMGGVEALLLKMLMRMEDGKQRISRALEQMMSCREKGDREGALQAMRDVLDKEIVPKYREMAEECLARYDEPPPDW